MLFLDKLFSPLTIILAVFSVLVSSKWWNLAGAVLLIAVIAEVSLPIMQILRTFNPVTFLVEIISVTVWIVIAIFARKWWKAR